MDEDLPEILNNHQLLLGLHEGTLQPTKPWDYPEEEEVDRLIAKIERRYPDELTLERICRGSLGLYLFTKFCREKHEDVYCNFIIDVCNYRKSIGTNRLEMAAKLWSAYMDQDSTGEMLSEVTNDCSRRSTLEVVADSKISSVLTAEEAGESVAQYNALGVCGPAVDQIAAAINGIIGELGAEVIPPPTPLQEDDLGEPIHSSESKESLPDHTTSPVSMTRTPSTSNSRPSSGRFAPTSHDMGFSSAAYGRHQRGSSIMDGKSDMGESMVHGSQVEEDVTAELSNMSAANIEWSVDGRDTMSVSGVSRTGSFVGRSSAASAAASPKVDSIKRPMGLTPLAIPRARNFDLDAGSTPGSEPPTPSSTTDVRVRANMLPSQVGGFVPLECLENIKASLPRDLYDTVEAEIFRRLLHKYEDEFRKSEEYRVYFKFLCIQTRPLTMDDFKQYRKLGRGGFGDVYAVKRCTTGKMYALKIMDKRRVKAKQSEDLCLHERKILAQVDSPFICCLKYAFTTQNELCLILDLMPGGDLGFHLNRVKRFPPATARYYASRTLLAIAHMHSKKIVYRDLKPDNVLLDLRGRSFLSDLGLATKVKPSLRGVAGTRGYWAPDMLRRQADGRRRKYDQRVDFFSLGCFIYEMLVGVCPFRTERAATWPLTEDDEREIQKQMAKELGIDVSQLSMRASITGKSNKITRLEREKRMKRAIDNAILQMEPDYPRDYFDETAKDLVKGLLNKDPDKRLGARGPEDIMRHRWFAELNWDDVAGDRYKPPITPAQDEINANALSQIGEFTDAELKDVRLTEEDEHLYRSWNYTNSRAFQEEIVEFLRTAAAATDPQLQPPVNCCCSIQ